MMHDHSVEFEIERCLTIKTGHFAVSQYVRQFRVTSDVEIKQNSGMGNLFT